LQILLVEDEESLRLTLAANLELEGHGVVEASDAEAALELLRNVKIDLILSDIRMPGMGGVELLRRARTSDPNLPVVLMTAYTAEDQLDQALLGGVFTVLKKPFDVGAIARVLSRAVAGPLVLVVDDDPQVATSGIEVLRMAGLRAEAAFSGDEALASLETGRFDVCVTDLVMPGMDGPTLIGKLRAKWPSLGVILSSGYDVRELLQRLPNTGVDACLRKPVSSRDLLRSLARTRGGRYAA
jgi:CheY-like chemotaxis protein